MGSVDQRAAKLLAVNAGGLKKKSANRPLPHSKQSAWVRTRADWLTGAGAGWQTFLEISNFDSW